MKYIFVAQSYAEASQRAAEEKAIKKLCGSQRILGGSLRNKKMQKPGGMGSCFLSTDYTD